MALSQAHKELDAIDESWWVAAIHMATTREAADVAAWLNTRSTPAAARRTDHDGALHCL